MADKIPKQPEKFKRKITVGVVRGASGLAAALLATAMLKRFKRIKKSFYPVSAGRRIFCALDVKSMRYARKIMV